MNFREFFFAFQIFMSLVSAPMIAGFVAPIICILRQIFIVPINRTKYLEKAITDGHVVQSTLISTRKLIHDVKFINGKRIERNESIYEYVWGGQPYKYRSFDYDEVAEENITLYFQNKPDRACRAKELGKMEWKFLKTYLLSMVICAIGVFFLMGVMWKDQF